MQESKGALHKYPNPLYVRELLEEEMLSHFVLIQNGVFIHVPCSFSAMFGFTPAEMLGTELIGYIQDEQREGFLDSWKTVFPGPSVKLRTTGTDAYGSKFQFEMLVTVKKRDLQCYYTIISWTNLSSRIQEAKAVKEMGERFRAAFDYAAVGMALISFTGHFLDVNFALCEMLGLGSADWEQLTMKECIYDEDYGAYLENCTLLLISEIASYETELRCKHPSGTPLWGLLNATLVRDDDGKPQYFIIQLQDISKRKEAEELLRKSDKLSAVGQLAAGVAHEVRNPLTVLKGFAQMLHSADKKNSHYYQLMLSEVDRIESIIGEFLLLARPQETQFRKANLCLILQDVITLMETKAVMNKVEIMPLLPPDIPEMECDVNQLKQVFINMIQNAIEAMPLGGQVAIEVRLSARATVSIRITDQGCGISDDRIQRLGEPFYSSKEKGTGLGLMVSYQIIEKHKGRILITSKLDVGTTFEIQLPINQTVREQDQGG